MSLTGKRRKVTPLIVAILAVCLIVPIPWGGAADNEAYAAPPPTADIDDVVSILGGANGMDGEKAFDYLSYVFLGWRTTGGHWQNQVVGNFIPDILDDAGFTSAGGGAAPSTSAPGTTDMSAATDNPSDTGGDYAWTTYYPSSSNVWDPEYARLEVVSAPSSVPGLAGLKSRIEVESSSFDPTSTTYIDYYNTKYGGISDIDDMWDWVTAKDGSGVRVNVFDNGDQPAEEAELGERAKLAWQTSFTAPKGTSPATAPGVSGAAVYVGTVGGTSNNRTASEFPGLTGAALAAELAGKVLLSDSSLSNTTNLAKQVGAVAVMSKSSLSNYSTPKTNGVIDSPFNKSSRYASGTGTANSLANMNAGKPIVEWQFSNDQYDALRELLRRAGSDPVILNSVSIGDIYPMNDASHGGVGQAVTIAEVKGATKPDERILICAHSQEPGSNDNATGVGALLELATRYKQMIDNGDIARPARTITFLWGDEMTMATLWMNSHATQKTKLVAALDMDMVGEDPDKTGGTMRIEKTPDPSATYNYTLDTLPWEDDDGLYYDPDTYADPDGLFTRLPDSHTLWGAGSVGNRFRSGYYLNDLYMAAAQSVISNHDPTFRVDVCPYEGGSDHSTFLAQNVPALLTWHFNDYTYHSSVDTLFYSSAQEMENVNITTLATAYMMADTTDSNETFATEILNKVYDAAVDRLATEKQNTKNHYKYIKATGADWDEELAEEKAALAAWTQWYIEAIESVKDYLIMATPSSTYLALEQQYLDDIADIGEANIAYAENKLQAFGSEIAVETPGIYATKKDDHKITVTLSGIEVPTAADAQDIAESLQFFLAREEEDSPFITVDDPNIEDSLISDLFEGSIYTGDLLSNWKVWSTGGSTPDPLFTGYTVTGTAIDDAGVVVEVGFTNEYFFADGTDSRGFDNGALPKVGSSVIPRSARAVYQSFIGDYTLSVVSGGATVTDGVLSGGDVLATDKMEFNHYESYTPYPEMYSKLLSLQKKAQAKGYSLTIESIGKSSGGLEQYAVVFGKKGKAQQWLSLTDTAESNPDLLLDKIESDPTFLDKVALPLYMNNVHPDECPGSDVMFELLEKLIDSTTIPVSWLDGWINSSDAPGQYISEPLKELGATELGRAGDYDGDGVAYGDDDQGAIDPFAVYTTSSAVISVSDLLDDVFFLMTPNENPDGRTSNTRRNYNGFDLNRDGSFQTQPETQHLEPFIAKWNPIIMDEFHGYVQNFLIEPCTPPHEQNLEYDLLVKNFYFGAEAFGNTAIASIQEDFGRADLAENGYTFSRYFIPLRDMFSTEDGWDGWDDLATSYGPSYAMINSGTLGYTIEIPYNNEGSTQLLVYGSLGHAKYMMDNKESLLTNQLNFFKRGVDNTDVTTDPIILNDIEKWYVDDDDEIWGDDVWRPKYTGDGENGKFFPEFYVIPIDADAQRDPADVEAFTEYLLRNDVKLKKLTADATIDGTVYKAGSIIVDMHQGKRNYANAVLWKGIDSSFYDELYSEAVVNFPQQRGFTVVPVAKTGQLPTTGIADLKKAATVGSMLGGDDSGYTAVVIDNNGQEAVKAVNALLDDGKEVGLVTTGDNMGDFVVSKAVWESVSDDYTLVGTGVKKAGGDVYAIQKPKVYVPGLTNGTYNFKNTNPYFSYWFADGFGSNRYYIIDSQDTRNFDVYTFGTQFGFEITTDGDDATVVAGSLDFNVNAANESSASEQAALDKVLSGTPYIAAGASVLANSAKLKTDVLAGLTVTSATTSSSESLHHVVYDADSPITAPKAAAGDDIVYNYGGGRFTAIPDGAEVLYRTGSIADGFHIAGCFPAVSDSNLGDKIEAFTYEGENGSGDSVDVVVFGNSVTRKSHQLDDAALAATAIFLKSIDEDALLEEYSGVEEVITPVTPTEPAITPTEPAITPTGPAVTPDGEKQQTTEKPVAKADIPGVSVPVEPGAETQLPASVTFDDGTSADVTWTAGGTGDTGKATVGSDGKLKGTVEGKVTLVGVSKTDPTKKITVTITIAKNVTAVRTPLKTLYLKKGKAITPPVCADSINAATGKADTSAKLTWKSSNKKVATVNATTGKITPKKKGKATITATALNGKKLTIKVNVVTKATALKKVTLTKPPKSLKVGKTAILKVKATPAKATNLLVKFSSSKKSVVSVDKAGKITALKKGTAKITVKIGKKKYVLTVKVK